MPRMPPLPFILLILLLLFHSSSGEADGIAGDGVELVGRIHEVISSRKLRDIMLDYEDGGANKRHDPRKGKPGVGG